DEQRLDTRHSTLVRVSRRRLRLPCLLAYGYLRRYLQASGVPTSARPAPSRRAHARRRSASTSSIHPTPLQACSLSGSSRPVSTVSVSRDQLPGPQVRYPPPSRVSDVGRGPPRTLSSRLPSSVSVALGSRAPPASSAPSRALHAYGSSGRGGHQRGTVTQRRRRAPLRSEPSRLTRPTRRVHPTASSTCRVPCCSLPHTYHRKTAQEG
ncbi:hypothetical protein C8T65DRAFT_831285, partial [Cerioporus squamosus]